MVIFIAKVGHGAAICRKAFAHLYLFACVWFGWLRHPYDTNMCCRKWNTFPIIFHISQKRTQYDHDGIHTVRIVPTPAVIPRKRAQPALSLCAASAVNTIRKRTRIVMVLGIAAEVILFLFLFSLNSTSPSIVPYSTTENRKTNFMGN